MKMERRNVCLDQESPWLCWDLSLLVELETSLGSIGTDLVLPRPYLFIHIPKSGGTSVGRVAELEVNGGGPRKFIRYWHHPVRPEVIAEMVQHDFVFGHFKYGIHEHFKGRNFTYMTILRNPVDRVISHYYYHLNSESDRFHNLAADNPIEKWVEVSIDANNDHTQFISGRHGIPTEEDYERALENLKTFGFVGIYERFDETMVMLKHYAGFENVFYNHTKSVIGRPKAKDLPPQTIKKILEYVKYDQLLYEEGQRMFERQRQAIGVKRLTKEVVAFRAELEAYQQQFNHSCVDCYQQAPGTSP